KKLANRDWTTTSQARHDGLHRPCVHRSGYFAAAPNAEFVVIVRARLQASLALVKAAKVMPWNDMPTIIREDNSVRFGKDVLPPAEGAALWAEFNVEMDRL
ncbi:MAG TPA: hypothetical protein DDZ81_23555, partial [Acetobacteraceae bacterium]|nr:hypothetical protein [Acetobacteraceae bacterium]